MNSSVALETNCFERDWKILIQEGGYERKLYYFQDIGVKFSKHVLIINNVCYPKQVCIEADKLISKGIISEWYLVDDHALKVLDFFKINRDTFFWDNNDGYNYSMSPLVAVNVIEADYILHLASDVKIESGKKFNWVDSALPILEKRSDVVAANPVWYFQYNGAQNDAKGNEDNDWYYITRFSDQCYLMKKTFLNRPIYGEGNEWADIYFPKYAGNSFEKRVYSYLKNRNLLTITSKHISYEHPSY